ncbi:MAG: outer membrane lipoprotein carrier protein LolA [Thermodesulfobacteriota bacterium]
MIVNRTKRSGLFLLALSVALCVLSAATVWSSEPATPAPEEIVRKVQHLYSQHVCFQARFNQLTVNVAMDMTDRFEGTMYVKRPASIALEVETPEKQRIVVRERAFLVYFPDDGGSTRGEIPPEIDVSHFIGFFANIRDIEKGFTVAFPSKTLDTADRLYFIELTDKKNPQSTYRVVLGIDMTEFTVRRAIIYDALGNYNRFDLTGIRFLDDIPDWRFNLNAEVGKPSQALNAPASLSR